MLNLACRMVSPSPHNRRLKSLSGIDSIDAQTIAALHMIYNDSLSWCAVESVCQYLGSPNPSTSIQNAVGCESIETVEEYCQQGISLEWAPLGSIWHYTQVTLNPDLISYTTIESVSDTVINGRRHDASRSSPGLMVSRPFAHRAVLWSAEE
jgi:hypothetical protein